MSRSPSAAYLQAFEASDAAVEGIPLNGAQRRFARGAEWSGHREVVGVRVTPLTERWTPAASLDALQDVVSAFPLLRATTAWDHVPYLAHQEAARVAFSHRLRARRACLQVEAELRTEAELGTSSVTAALVD